MKGFRCSVDCSRFCETPVFLPNCAHDATGAPTDPLAQIELETLRSQQFAVFYREGHRHLCCRAERSFSDHTETDAAHPEDKTVEISSAIL